MRLSEFGPYTWAALVVLMIGFIVYAMYEFVTPSKPADSNPPFDTLDDNAISIYDGHESDDTGKTVAEGYAGRIKNSHYRPSVPGLKVSSAGSMMRYNTEPEEYDLYRTAI